MRTSKIQDVPRDQYVIIIDGVESIAFAVYALPCVLRPEQLRKNGFAVRVVNASEFSLVWEFLTGAVFLERLLYHFYRGQQVLLGHEWSIALG